MCLSVTVLLTRCFVTGAQKSPQLAEQQCGGAGECLMCTGQDGTAWHMTPQVRFESSFCLFVCLFGYLVRSLRLGGGGGEVVSSAESRSVNGCNCSLLSVLHD